MSLALSGQCRLKLERFGRNKFGGFNILQYVIVNRGIFPGIYGKIVASIRGLFENPRRFVQSIIEFFSHTEIFAAVFGFSLFFSIFASDALAQNRWQYRYLPSSETDYLSVCTAGIFYGDGSFIVRIYEGRIDFYFERTDFSLPPEEYLGLVAFRFKDEAYVLSASTAPLPAGERRGFVQHLFLNPLTDDIVDIFVALRYSNDFAIIFPDDSGYTIDLAGSNAAIAEAIECWNNKHTGQGGLNPFGAGSGKRNPFQ